MADQQVSYIIRARDAYSAAHKKADQTIDKTAKNVVKAAGVMTVAVAGVSASLFAMAKTTADSGDEFQKMSARLGISSQALSEMKHATELSGASLQTYEMGLRKLSKGALEADRGMATYKRTFDELGISVRDANGQMKDSDALFMEVVEGLNNVESSTRKTALAQELLGRSGTMLLPLINAGADGIKEMREEAVALGITFSEIDANESAEFVDAMLRVKGSVVGLKNTFGKELLPVFTTVMNDISESFIDFKEAGDLDVWAADVAEGVITSFSEVAVFAVQLPVAFNATMVGIKTMTAGAVAGLQALTVPLQNYYELWTDLTGGEEGFVGGDAKRKASALRDFNKVIEKSAVDLLISAEANKEAGDEAAIWALKQESAIDRVRNKLREGLISDVMFGPELPPEEGGEDTGNRSLLAQTEADKIISIQQAKFQRIHEMAVESDLNNREMSALKLMRQLEEFEADRVRLAEAALLTTDLKAQFLFAEEEALLLHEQRLTDIEAQEKSKRIGIEQNYQKLKFQTAVTGFGNLLILTKSSSKSVFRAVQLLNVATAVMDSKAAIVGAYKHGAIIGGPVLGAGYALAAAAASAPLVSAITSASLSLGGGGGGGGGGGPVPSPPSQDTGSLIGTSDSEEIRQVQQITLNIKALDPSEINWDNYSEQIVDTINKAGKERDVKIELEAVAR